ncbi:MAG: endo-1,4-beta-xylanase [Oscillospiraceae bacterium]|nr:endo-1,4-beta-xylanase [Oscillospiraceae bacterium]
MTIAEYRAACMEHFNARKDELDERARVNIEQHRKGNHTLQLLDKDGKPAAGVSVHVKLTNHDFRHGANIFMLDQFDDPEVNQRFREAFPQYFNAATVPFYFAGNHPEEGVNRFDKDSSKIFRRPPTDLCVEYCEANGIAPKLHCLYYDKMTPEWARKKSADELWDIYEKRFADIAERYTGRLYEIEVTNETTTLWRSTTTSALARQRDTTIRMWQMARRYFPYERLVVHDAELCDVGIGSYHSPFYLTIENLLHKKATINKVAVQNHIFMGVSGSQEKDLQTYIKHLIPENLLHGIEVLGSFDLPLEISEITIPTFGEGEEAEQLQADILRMLYTFWFATPQIENVTWWNTADFSAITVPGWDENNCRGGLFHPDMTPKLAALEQKRLFDEEWHTELDLVTDADGKVTFRGFYGDYQADFGGESFQFGLHRTLPHITTYQKQL